MGHEGAPPASDSTPSASGAAVPMSLIIRPLGPADARAISAWRYPQPYDIYDMDMRWPMLIQRLYLFFGRGLFFAAYTLDTSGETNLVGYFSFVKRDDMLDVGVAMRPDLTGQGRGLSFVLAGLAFARETFKPARFRLDVAEFNTRARRVYERARFRPVRTVYRRIRYREYACIEMVRDA